MANHAPAKIYTPAEERLNVLSHGAGLVLSIIGLPMLLWRASQLGDVEAVVASLVFGTSMIVLYGASVRYHSETRPDVRARLRIIDHAAIFFLIAGTYTPFTLLVLDGFTGWLLFGSVWGLALSGVVLKLFFTGRFRHLSTGLYLLTGWMLVFAIEPLIDNLAGDGLAWLIGGGLAYTVGALLYGIRSLPFNHGIFHLFVLLGSFCHFIAVWAFVLTDD